MASLLIIVSPTPYLTTGQSYNHRLFTSGRKKPGLVFALQICMKLHFWPTGVFPADDAGLRRTFSTNTDGTLASDLTGQTGRCLVHDGISAAARCAATLKAIIILLLCSIKNEKPHHNLHQQKLHVISFSFA